MNILFYVFVNAGKPVKSKPHAHAASSVLTGGSVIGENKLSALCCGGYAHALPVRRGQSFIDD